MFREHDREGLGIINSITFTYLMNEYVGISEDKIVSIIKILDPSNKNLINFMDFIRLVHDNSSLDTMPLFKLGEKLSAMATENQNMEAGKFGSVGENRSEAPYFTPVGVGVPEGSGLPILQSHRPPTGPDRMHTSSNLGPGSGFLMPNGHRSVTTLGS